MKKFFDLFKRTKNYRTSKTILEVNQIENDTEQLCDFIYELKNELDKNGCQCSFPRFRQIVALDCVADDGNYYISETENIIKIFKDKFSIIDINHDQSYLSKELWTCKFCNSTYEYERDEFSAYVSRSVLKIKDLKIRDVGNPEIFPIPLFIGPFGHTKPSKEYIELVDFSEFKRYILG